MGIKGPSEKPPLYSGRKEGRLPRPPKGVLFSKVEVGQRIRALRDERGLSQAELAELLGVHQTNISTMERGMRALTIHQVMKLSKALRVSIDEILTGGKTRPNGALDRRFLRRLQKVDKLSKRDQQTLLGTIDAFLSKVE